MNFKTADSWLAQPQNKLGGIGLLVLMVLATLVMPLALDMYTPAIPHMTEYFETTDNIVNLTMTGYFLFFAVGLLIFGPLSDRYGRKPILLVGIISYTVASILCALSTDILFLIGARVIQALGAGAVNAVNTAIVKDAIKSERRELVLSFVQVMFVVGPVLSPVIGALVLQFADWRVIFWAIALVGTFCTILSFFYEETLSEKGRHEGTVFGSLKQLTEVGKNKGFMSFLVVIGLFNLPFMAYIAVASYIYISYFGMSELQYSLFFAVASLVTAAGPFIWLKASKYISARKYTNIILFLAFLTGIAILLVGTSSPYAFCLFFLIFALVESSVRPYSTNILLSQQEDDAGSASSLINFVQTALGCVGMLVAVLPWVNYAFGIGMIVTLAMALSGVIWFVFLRSSIPLKGIKDDPDKRIEKK